MQVVFPRPWSGSIFPKDMRARSVSRREQSLEEEHQAMREFLKGTEDEQLTCAWLGLPSD